MKRRSKIDVEISRQQKNARNKLYRLRKKGAINAQIGASFNPVRPASELKGMSYSDKRRYLSSLKKFNNRKNAFTFFGEKGQEHIIQAESNTAIPAQLNWEYRIAEAAANVVRASQKKYLLNLREKSLKKMSDKQFDEFSYMDYSVADAEEMDKLKDFKQIVRHQPFADIKNVQNAIASMQRREAKNVFNEDQLKHWKESIVNVMEQNQFEKADIKLFEKISLNNLALLNYFTDFTELVSSYNYKKADGHTVSGYITPGAIEDASNKKAIRGLLRVFV